MSIEQAPQTNPEILKQDRVLVVCKNGRTRSRVVSESLKKLGVDDVGKMAVTQLHDLLKDKDWVNYFKKYTVVIFVKKDVEAKFRHYANLHNQTASDSNAIPLPRTITIDFPERLHAELHGKDLDEETFDKVRSMFSVR